MERAYSVYISVVGLVVAAVQHPESVIDLNRAFRAFIAVRCLL